MICFKGLGCPLVFYRNTITRRNTDLQFWCRLRMLLTLSSCKRKVNLTIGQDYLSLLIGTSRTHIDVLVVSWSRFEAVRLVIVIGNFIGVLNILQLFLRSSVFSSCLFNIKRATGSGRTDEKQEGIMKASKWVQRIKERMFTCTRRKEVERGRNSMKEGQ